MSRKPTIEAHFARSADCYDAHCEIQKHVGARLASLLPFFERPSVLELGCGTGIFTAQLMARYASGRFLITDFSKNMVGACSRAIGQGKNRAFEIVDADFLAIKQKFDIVVSSMALHWLDDPHTSLEKQRKCLKPGGKVLYATIGVDNFPQWRHVLDELGLDNGVYPGPALPGIVFDERVTINYGDAHGFLMALKKTGASIARPGYQPLGFKDLKKACTIHDRQFAGTMTWHLVYGVVEADISKDALLSREMASVRG